MEQTGKFFLTWTYGWEYCHDGDEWVAVCTSPEELRREYLRAYEERGCDPPDLDYLQAYEYLGRGRSREVPPEEFLEEKDPRTPVTTLELRREYWRKREEEHHDRTGDHLGPGGTARAGGGSHYPTAV